MRIDGSEHESLDPEKEPKFRVKTVVTFTRNRNQIFQFTQLTHKFQNLPDSDWSSSRFNIHLMSRIFEDSLVNNRQFLVFPRWNPTPRRELTLWEIPGVSGCGKIPPVGNWRQSVIELALLPLHSFGQKQGKYINSRWLVRVSLLPQKLDMKVVLEKPPLYGTKLTFNLWKGCNLGRSNRASGSFETVFMDLLKNLTFRLLKLRLVRTWRTEKFFRG